MYNPKKIQSYGVISHNFFYQSRQSKIQRTVFVVGNISVTIVIIVNNTIEGIGIMKSCIHAVKNLPFKGKF